MSTPSIAPHPPLGADPDATRNRGGSAKTTRLSRFFTGAADDARWVRPSLLLLLAATAVFYFWNLSSSGWANSFYTAAVQAGSKSWKAMFFGSLDSSNAITVDKPPGSLWIMSLSVRVFGLNSWAVLAPQVLMGVGTVGVVYTAVKRVVGPGAGLIAGLVLATTPIAALMFRFNNPDALLALLLALAAYAVFRGQESGKTKWLALAGTCVGFAFLTKTLQAFLILPAFTAVFLATGPGKFVRRLWQLLVALGALIVSAGWWVAIVQLWPASSRPYIGGSQDNSFWNLTFGYNGLGRLNGQETGSVGGGGAGGGFGRAAGDAVTGAGGAAPGAAGGMQLPPGMTSAQAAGMAARFGGGGGGAPGGGGGGAGGFGSGTGLTRMFNSSQGTQISWLLPAALFLLVVGLVITLRSPRTDLRRAALLLWSGGLLSTAAVFSYMQGIFHPYYTVALAPGIAVLVGIGAGLAWEKRDQLAARAALAAALLGTAAWAYVMLDWTPNWNSWLRYVIVALSVIAAAGLLLVNQAPAVARRIVVVAGVTAALLAPAGFALATVNTGHTGSLPTAGPTGAGGRGGPGRMPGGNFGDGRRFGGPGQLGGQGQTGGRGGFGGQGQTGGNVQGGTGAPGGAAGGIPAQGGMGGPGGTTTGGGNAAAGGMGGLLDATTPSKTIQAMIEKDASSYKWVAAAIGAQNAAGYQLATQEPVMAIGGFNGSDPSPTLAQFQEYVAKKQIHYYIGGGIGNGSSSITTWVTAHFKAQTVDGVTFYDLTATPSS